MRGVKIMRASNTAWHALSGETVEETLGGLYRLPLPLRDAFSRLCDIEARVFDAERKKVTLAQD